MNESRNVRSKKGQVGVGTLIVFIAMILVAAIAAAVLVRTAGNLQSKAILTGERSKSQVSTNIETILLTGSNGTNQNVEDFRQLMRLAPGSDGIKLAEATLKIDTAAWSADLAYGNASNATDGCVSDGAQNSEALNGYWTNASGSGFYTVDYVEQGPSYVDGYFQRGDLIRLCFAGVSSVSRDTDMTFTFVPSIGNIHVVQTATPNMIVKDTTRLFP